MKGISYITDEKNRKKAIVIDLKMIEQHDEEVHELIDVLVAESRKDDESISWAAAKKQLKRKGELWVIQLASVNRRLKSWSIFPKERISKSSKR